MKKCKQYIRNIEIGDKYYRYRYIDLLEYKRKNLSTIKIYDTIMIKISFNRSNKSFYTWITSLIKHDSFQFYPIDTHFKTSSKDARNHRSCNIFLCQKIRKLSVRSNEN